MNVRSCGPQRIVKDVGVQTAPEIDDIYIPWLLEAERKTEDFYVQLTNLVNTLYHSESGVLKAINKTCPPSGTSIISTHFGKSCQPNLNFKSSSYTKLPKNKSENLDCPVSFLHIENRIHSILRSAMDLKSSIPKAGSGKLGEIREQNYEIVKSKTVKQTSIVKLQSTKSLPYKTTNLPSHVYKKKRTNTLPTVSESKYVEKRQVCEMPIHLGHGNGKSDLYCVPKTKISRSARSTASGTVRQTCNDQAKQLSPELPTKDTGAIPKTRDVRKATGANTVVKAQKAKKTNVKPLWR